MNIVLDIDKIEKKNIFFYEPVKNTVIMNSNFIRILYSNKELMMNGLYIKFNINKDLLKNNKENKDDENKIIIKYLEDLEIYILNKYINSTYIFKLTYKIREQISYLINKINNCNNDRVIFSYILKISGLWESDNELGLTYKFIYM